MTFEQQLAKFAEKTGQNTDRVIVQVCAGLSGSIIEKTPVLHGRARGNWIATIGSASKNTLKKTDKRGGNTAAKAQRTALKAPGRVFYFINNLPYIIPLEYGGYPQPVKRGTWRKDKGMYEVRSSGGYSTQAPRGMVGLSVLEFRKRLREAINEL
jgi:hypothetical protein